MVKQTRKIINNLQRNYTIIADDFSQTRSKHLPSDLKKLLKNVNKGDDVLDVGCGNARIYQALKGKKISYTGIDFTLKFIKQNKKKYPNADFKLIDVTKNCSWSKVDKQYDVVFCTAVLHHLPGNSIHKKVIEQMKAVLKPGGQLIITVWNLWQKRFWQQQFMQIPRKLLVGFKLKWFWYPYKISDGEKVVNQVERFHYAFTKKELRTLLEKSGLKIEQAYYSYKDTRTNWKKGANLCFIAKK